MRAMFLVMASVLLAVGLFGCNRPAEAPAAAPVVAATPPAALPPPQAPVEPTVRHTRHHDRHYASRSYGAYDERTSYSQSSSEYSQDDSGSDYADNPPPPPPGNAQIWVDGYGREHAVTDEGNPAHVGAPYRRARRDPWHGYSRQ